jgi:tetratricopeptide (TPR) repeat protein
MAEAERDARGALQLFETAGDELGQARAWRLLSAVHWANGHGAAAESANENDLAHARRSGHAREPTEAFCILSAIVVTGPIPVADAILRCEDILRREAGNRAVEAWMWHALAHLRARLGEFAEARELAIRSDAVLQTLGQSYEAAILSELRGDVELLAGDPAAAVLALTAGLETTERAGRPSLMLAAFLSQAAMAASRTDVAEAAAEQAITGGGWVRAIAQGTLGRVRATQGRFADADLLTREAVDYFEGTDFLTFHARARLDRAEALQLSGRREAAIDAVRMAKTLHDRKGSHVEAGQTERLMTELATHLPLETSP